MKKYNYPYNDLPSRLDKYEFLVHIIIGILMITFFCGIILYSTVGQADVLVSTPPIYPKTVVDLNSCIKWLNTFEYQEDITDYWKSPEETVRDNGGDCEDFGILVDYVLKKLGYNTTILALYFSDGDSGHIITIVKIDGHYTFFSNNIYFQTKFTSLRTLLTSYYPNWEKCYLISRKLLHKGILIGRR